MFPLNLYLVDATILFLVNVYLWKLITYTFILTLTWNGIANRGKKKPVNWDWEWYPCLLLHSETSLWPIRHKGSSLWHFNSQRCLFQVRISRVVILQSSYCYNTPALKTFTAYTVIWTLEQTTKVSAGSTTQTKIIQNFKNSLEIKNCDFNSFHYKAVRIFKSVSSMFPVMPQKPTNKAIVERWQRKLSLENDGA